MARPERPGAGRPAAPAGAATAQIQTTQQVFTDTEGLLASLAGRAARGEGGRLETIYKVSSAIGAIADHDQLLDRILEIVLDQLPAERGFILVDEKGDGGFRVEAARDRRTGKLEVPPQVSMTIIQEVARRREAVLCMDATQDARFSHGLSVARLSLRSVMAVPLLERGRVAGVIELDSSQASKAFSRDDLEMLNGIALQASIALERFRLQGDLVREQRLSTIGAMASTIIHDLRNPMTAIKGFAYLLGKRNPENHECVGVIVAEVERINGMLQEILEFSRGGTSLQVADADVGVLMDDFFRTLERDLAESPELVLERRVDYRGALPMDRERMRRVLFNLVHNARDAMEGRGRLLVGVARDGDDVVFRVEDTGKGMDEETQARLFEPFFTRGKKGGFGLGMAIVQNVVQGHGGRVEVASAPGKGTTIRVRLPAGP
ncbi:MAG: GAF domain-containing protein [Planctomycetes bacterium]|nr:GAF domain-containing protein [Planctomycetota bacterium]